jgi:hypothetical protein
MGLEIGAEVRVTEDFKHNGVSFKAGSIGEVKHVHEHTYSMDWDFYDEAFHSCGGFCGTKYGFYIDKSTVEKLERVDEMKFGKKDLEQGDIVEYACGEKGKLIKDLFTDAKGGYSYLANFNEGLINKLSSGYSIKKVYRTSTDSKMCLFIPNDYYKVVFEREEVKVTMTIEEIEAKLGYKISIEGEK